MYRNILVICDEGSGTLLQSDEKMIMDIRHKVYEIPTYTYKYVGSKWIRNLLNIKQR